MSEAIKGAAEIAGAATMGLGAFFDPALLANPMYLKAMEGLVVAGVASEAGAIASALGSKSGIGITTRTPAALRQIVRGVQRVGGNIVYCSTTGSTHRQYNMIIVLATHTCESIENLYLDGRQVVWDTSTSYNQTVGSYNFGGNAVNENFVGPNGVQYNFGGLVFAAAFYGNQNSNPTVVDGVWVGPNNQAGFCSGLQANDPTWSPTTVTVDGQSATNTPYLAGCTYIYLKIEADSGTFPQFPEIRVTLHGKNDIYDPRTGAKGYSANWALNMADAIMDPTWGLGDNAVNMDQLIAAANVCDELVPCAAGQEVRYALNMHNDTSAGPGDAIDRMMASAAGRLSWIGGEWYIWPAYWQGASFAFDQNSLLDDIRWAGKRKLSELINRVTGTYTAPNYPYNVAGNLYDSNGFWNGETQNNFPFSFQPTNFPMYACDELHGYDEDVYLVADTPNQGAYNAATDYAAGTVVISGGVPWQALQATTGNAPAPGSVYWAPAGVYLPREIQLEDVLSISQVQRIAKIVMLRNRQQGSGTLVMSAAALAMQPIDVMQFDLPAMGWTNKLFEVAGEPGQKFKIRYAVPPSAGSDEEEQVPALFIEVPVNETDASVYEWDDTTEELTPYDAPAFSGATQIYQVAPPTSAAATSNLETALVQPDGAVTPRIELTWTEPVDTYVVNGGSIEIQMCAHGSSAWQDVLWLGGHTTIAFLGNVIIGSSYDLRLRSLRPSGAASAWVELDNIVIGTALSAAGLTPVAPSTTLTTNTVPPAPGSSLIAVNPFVASIGGLSANCLTAGAVVLSGLTPNQLYYVYYVDPTFAGGAITPIATLNTADFESKPGYWLIGPIQTPPYNPANNPCYYPSAASNLGQWGAYGVLLPPNVDPSTYLTVYALNAPTVYGGAGAGYGEVLLGGFASVPAIAGQALYVSASGGENVAYGTTSPWGAITASIGGGAKPAGQLGTMSGGWAWGANRPYTQWETFTEGSITYLVVTAYTSGASFGAADIANTCVLLAGGESSINGIYSVPLPTGISLSAVSLDFIINTPPPGDQFDSSSVQIKVNSVYIQ
jgi:hypothetical protein